MRCLVPIAALSCLSFAAAAVADGQGLLLSNPPGNLEFLEPAFGDRTARGDAGPAEVPVTLTGGGSDGPRFDVAFHGLLEFGITKRWENPE